MKYFLRFFTFLFCTVSFAQISPAIPAGGTIVSATVVSATATYSGTIKTNNTLTVNYGVDFTINGNMDGGTNKLICMGNNKIVVTGNVNSNVYLDMRGDVCLYVNGVFNTSSGYVTATGQNNFISCGSNMNNPGNLPPTVCGAGNSANPCSAPATLPCYNQCEQDQNSLGTWDGSNWKGNGNNNITMVASKRAVVNGNFASSSFSCCSLTVNAGKTLTINSGVVVTVANQIVNYGTIIIESGGSLVQQNDNSSTYGNITAKRTTASLKQYDYTYWSSPVKSAPLSTVSGSDYYSFDPTSGSSGEWTAVEGTTTMQQGTGYIARAPDNLVWANNPTLTATFTGAPNSGKISKTIYKNGLLGYNNLVGNPYPSAIDAQAFINANTANMTGNLYFWTHYTPMATNGNTTNYSSSDYAVYNLTGSTATKIGNISSTGEVVSNRPNGQIASGQGFFIEAKSNNVTINFTNSMRTGGTNTQFFRNASNDEGETENNRIWVNISNTEGAYSETLLGYLTGATNEIDDLYDASKLDGGNFVAIYTLLGETNLVIQGRALPFENSDIIPLGYNTTIPGTFSIALDEFDGLFEDQDVFLYDKANDTYTNLKNGSYTFSTEAGTFNNRFEIRFANTTLGTEIPVLDGKDIAVIKNGNQVQIKSTQENIASVVVYDLLGRTVYQKNNIGSLDFTTDNLMVNNQVVVVKVRTDNNLELVKKVIMN